MRLLELTEMRSFPVVSEYLENYEFGFMAGVLLVEAHHRHANTAMWDPMRRWPDFSDVETVREKRRSMPPPPLRLSARSASLASPTT